MRSQKFRFVAVVAVMCGLLAQATASADTVTRKVLNVWDGDTFEVANVDPNIRMIGIQAMELTKYAKPRVGQCHGPEAGDRLETLIGRKNVRLSGSVSGLKDRPQRFVSVYRDGKWRDVVSQMLREGHGLWFPNKFETGRNAKYQRDVRAAMRDDKGLWNPKFCGAGPQQTAKLKMWAQWDADSNDYDNVNGEWVKIKNAGSSAVNLSNWKLRDSSLRESHSVASDLRQFVFPSGTSVDPGKSVVVHIGKASAGLLRPPKKVAKRFYWGLADPTFENWISDGKNLGDGAYLFDPDGDIRSSFMYPCLKLKCPDPLKGKLVINHVEWDPDGTDTENNEYISVKNTSGSDINLEGYLLETWPYSYAFPAGSILSPNKTLKVTVGKGTDTAQRQFWGHSASVLANSGERRQARVRTFDNIVIHCKAWKPGGCTPPA